MTPEQFAEIKRRHADDARTHANTGQVSNGFADRAALIAEVERLREALEVWADMWNRPELLANTTATELDKARRPTAEVMKETDK